MPQQETHKPALLPVINTGIAGTLLILTITTLIIVPFETTAFTTWVSLAFVAATPAQMILGLFWGSSKPEWINSLPIALKGLVLTTATIIAGAIATSGILAIVGGGHGMSPMVIQYGIIAIVTMVWILLIWECWPISLITESPITVGILAFFANYLVAFAMWSVFFDYGALAEIQSSLYFADIDPQGLFPMWDATTFFVTVAGVIIVNLLFDFWPLEKLCWGKGQPIRGLVGSVYILLVSYALRWFFVDIIGMEQVDYMIRVPVCMIFGTFLVSNMMQNALFPSLVQPLKGLALLLLAIIAALIVYQLYAFASSIHAGHPLPNGPAGGYQSELWIASAMLSITFPVLFIVSGFFDLWPFKRR